MRLLQVSCIRSHQLIDEGSTLTPRRIADVPTAACVLEAFKFATTSAPYLNNYMMYTGSDSVYTYTFEHEKRPDCPVCGGESREMEVKKDSKLEDLIESLREIADL